MQALDMCGIFLIECLIEYRLVIIPEQDLTVVADLILFCCTGTLPVQQTLAVMEFRIDIVTLNPEKRSDPDRQVFQPDQVLNHFFKSRIGHTPGQAVIIQQKIFHFGDYGLFSYIIYP